MCALVYQCCVRTLSSVRSDHLTQSVGLMHRMLISDKLLHLERLKLSIVACSAFHWCSALFRLPPRRIYFAFPGRAEIARLCLAIGNVPYKVTLKRSNLCILESVRQESTRLAGGTT